MKKNYKKDKEMHNNKFVVCRDCVYFSGETDPKLISCAVHPNRPIESVCPDRETIRVFVEMRPLFTEEQPHRTFYIKSGQRSLWLHNDWILMGVAIAFGWMPKRKLSNEEKIISARRYLILCAGSKLSIPDPGFWNMLDSLD